MPGLNKVQLIGHLGAEPEVRPLNNGGNVANLRIATSERWRDKITGEPIERTEWHRVSIFGKLAEIAAQYLQKGSQVYIEGKLRTRKWQAQDGQDRYTTEIIVDISGSMQMLGARPDATAAAPRPNQNQHPNQHPNAHQTRTQAPAQTAAEAQFQAPPPFDDDIPF